MDNYTRIVVFSASAYAGDTDRILAGLRTYAEAHPNSAAFEHLNTFADPTVDNGFGEVLVGAVNHLDAPVFFEAVRAAAQNPHVAGEFAPVTVIVRYEDDDDQATTRTLNYRGRWSPA